MTRRPHQLYAACVTQQLTNGIWLSIGIIFIQKCEINESIVEELISCHKIKLLTDGRLEVTQCCIVFSQSRVVRVVFFFFLKNVHSEYIIRAAICRSCCCFQYLSFRIILYRFPFHWIDSRIARFSFSPSVFVSVSQTLLATSNEILRE